MKAIKYILLIFSAIIIKAQSLNGYLENQKFEEFPQNIVTIKRNILKEKSSLELAKYKYILGKNFEYLNQEDSALYYYMKSRDLFGKLNYKNQYHDLSLEIHKVISSQVNYDKYGYTFFNDYYNYASKTKSNERLALAYNQKAIEKFYEFDFDKRKNVEVIDTAIRILDTAYTYSQNSTDLETRVKILNNYGLFNYTKNDFQAAEKFFNQGIDLASKHTIQYELFILYYNYGNSFFIQKKYNEAVYWFLKAEAVPIQQYELKSKRLLYQKLKESYDHLNDHSNRKKYDSLYTDLNKKINDTEQNIGIHQINTQYQVVEKDKQISSLKKIAMNYQENKILYFFLIGIVFLIAMYSIIRWKRVDYRKKKVDQEKESLQIEHTQTIQELEKVKQLVIEDHIVLKNRTKIYLKELLYIKAEDHYLQLYTSKKKEFVRGKISEIIKELPPNFTQVHRSFIVNKNSIISNNGTSVFLEGKIEIPLSRNFKKNIE